MKSEEEHHKKMKYFLILISLFSILNCGNNHYCQYEYFTIESEFNIKIESSRDYRQFVILNEKYIFSTINEEGLIEFEVNEGDSIVKVKNDTVIQRILFNDLHFEIKNYGFDGMEKFMNGICGNKK